MIMKRKLSRIENLSANGIDKLNFCTLPFGDHQLLKGCQMENIWLLPLPPTKQPYFHFLMSSLIIKIVANKKRKQTLGISNVICANYLFEYSFKCFHLLWSEQY